MAKKLPDETYKKIIKLLKQGCKCKHIAYTTGTGYSTVGRIRSEAGYSARPKADAVIIEPRHISMINTVFC